MLLLAFSVVLVIGVLISGVAHRTALDRRPVPPRGGAARGGGPPRARPAPVASSSSRRHGSRRALPSPLPRCCASRAIQATWIWRGSPLTVAPSSCAGGARPRDAACDLASPSASPTGGWSSWRRWRGGAWAAGDGRSRSGPCDPRRDHRERLRTSEVQGPIGDRPGGRVQRVCRPPPPAGRVLGWRAAADGGVR